MFRLFVTLPFIQVMWNTYIKQASYFLFSLFPSFFSFFPLLFPFSFLASLLGSALWGPLICCSWALWTLWMSEKQSSCGLIGLADSPGCGVEGLECFCLAGDRRGDGDLERWFLGGFTLREIGLPGLALRGSTIVSPGCPIVRKTSGNVHGWLFTPCVWRRHKNKL